jgi:hypothetical protein
MSDEHKTLIPVEATNDDGGALIDVAADQGLLAETASGSGFLPYVQLFTTKSDAVAEGKIGGGEYGLVRDGNITSLGKDFNIIFLTVRARAFQKEDSGEITVVYDKKDPEYERIASLQAASVQGCMTGPEFLVWIPGEETFATFFCGSKTLKREARKFGTFLGGKAANLRSKLIDNGKYKWHGPVVNSCSVALSPLPDPADVAEQLEKFKNPPKPKQGERVDDSDAATDVAR